MIKTFKQKGLEKLFIKNDKSKIIPHHVSKILRILDRLDASVSPQDMNLPGYKLHELIGKEKGTWFVQINFQPSSFYIEIVTKCFQITTISLETTYV